MIPSLVRGLLDRKKIEGHFVHNLEWETFLLFLFFLIYVVASLVRGLLNRKDRKDILCHYFINGKLYIREEESKE